MDNDSSFSIDNHEIISSFIRQCSLSIRESDKEYIGEGDIVEAFDFEGVRLFRNVKFYELSSYSLEELTTHGHDELYHRPPEILAIFNRLQNQLITSKNPKVILPEFPEYYAVERRSVEKRRFKVKVKAIIPLFSQETQKIAAFLVSYRSELVDSYSKREVSDQKEQDLFEKIFLRLGYGSSGS